MPGRAIFSGLAGWRGLIIPLLLITAGIILRIWTLFFFEFKDDQFRAILDAADTLKRFFLVSHGMTSSTGIPNPPGFCWFCALVSLFAKTPFQFALVFLIISISTVPLWLLWMKDIVSREKLALVACLLSSSTALTVYSSNIWAQCLMPAICVGIIALLARFLLGGQKMLWTFSFWLCCLAGAIHFSGFFLLPLAILVLLKRRIPVRHFMISLIPPVLLLLPFAIHLAGFLSSGGRYEPSGGISAGRTLGFLLDFHSFGFAQYYLGNDLSRILFSQIGPLPSRLLATFANAIFCAMLICGILLFLAKFATRKRPYPEEESEGDRAVCLIAGIHLTTVSAAYLVLNISTYPHYFLATVPSGFILIAEFAEARPFGKLKKLLIYGAIAAQIILSSAMLFFIDSAGGHPLKYGVHYGTLERWRGEYEGFTRDFQGKSAVNIIPADESIIKASYSAITYAINPGQDGRVVPDRIYHLHIRWNEAEMRYEYEWILQCLEDPPDIPGR